MLGAVYGFFGGATVATVAVSLSGLDPQKAPGVMITAAICCAIGYFYFNSAENRHSKAFSKALEELESSERYRQKQAQWSEADRANAVLELRSLVNTILVSYPQIDPSKVPDTDTSPSSEASRLIGYLMDLGKLGAIPSAIGDREVARYDFLDVFPIHPNPTDLLRNP